MFKEEIIKKVKELSPWGQKIYLIDDIFTPGPLDTEQRWDFIKNFLPKDLKDMHVLDVGCSAGYFSVKIRELGTYNVVGIDFEHYIRQAKLVAEVKRYKNIEFRIQSIYKLNTSEKFNLTLCLGVLYHLKYPFLALKKMSEVTTEMLLLETEALLDEQDTDKIKFIEHTYKNDGTNWWIFGEECLKGMLRSVGFKFVKSYRYPDDHLIFGKHYYQGLTEEGINKGGRMVVVGLKSLDADKIGMLLSEIPDLEKEIGLNSLKID